MSNRLKELNSILNQPTRKDSFLMILLGTGLIFVVFFTIFYPVPASINSINPNSLYFSFFPNNPIFYVLINFMAFLGLVLLGRGAKSYSKLSRKIFLGLSVIILMIGIIIFIFGINLNILLYEAQGFIVFLYGFFNLGYSFKIRNTFYQ